MDSPINSLLCPETVFSFGPGRLESLSSKLRLTQPERHIPRCQLQVVTMSPWWLTLLRKDTLLQSIILVLLLNTDTTYPL